MVEVDSLAWLVPQAPSGGVLAAPVCEQVVQCDLCDMHRPGVSLMM